jgi:thiosulfate reductase cytochrome b subunit
MVVHAESAGKPIRRYRYLRHTWPVRIMHWINLVALTLLLMSGLQIFNAHPTLNWGKSSYNGDRPVLQMRAENIGNAKRVGITEIFGRSFQTTGVFGASTDDGGALIERGFPSWLTIPSYQDLAMGRRWHFLIAWVFVINGLVYLGYAVWSRHLAKDLLPTGRDWRSVGHSLADHLRFRHPQGEEAKHYNVLQKVTYLTVILGLLPLLFVMGMAMSPRMDTLWPGWVDIVGGRQSARTLHFVAACLIVLFVLIHVFEVIVSGLGNQLRSMITGSYEIEERTQIVAPATVTEEGTPPA